MVFAYVLLIHTPLFLLLTSPLPIYACTVTSPPKLLNVTTIAADARNRSTLECWQLTAPFLSSSVAGGSGLVVAQLGETAAMSYGVIPPGFDGGLHTAPAVT